MEEQWKQFSLYPPGCRNKFQPLQVLHTFLPKWLDMWGDNIERWHILFEPSALIRFQTLESGIDQRVLVDAKAIATEQGLEFEPGDSSCDLNPELKYPGENYHGEAEFYGIDLWDANCKFMQACGELSIEIAKLDHKKQVFMMRKFLHLYGNILGMNYLEEAAHSQIWADRAKYLFTEHGRS